MRQLVNSAHDQGGSFMASLTRAQTKSPARARSDRKSLFAASVLCIVAAAAFILGSRSAIAQEMGNQPVSYPATAPMMPPAPTWDDFNGLAQRLQATEARLQAISSNATYETAYDY